MRRRSQRSGPSPTGPGDHAVEDPTGPGDQAVKDPPAGDQADGPAGGDSDVWRETWEEAESERVARWLESKTHRAPNADAGPVRPTTEPRLPRAAAARAASKPDREESRRSLVAGIESVRQEVDAHRAQERKARSALEAEIRSLERQRRRLAADLELQEAEADHVRSEHLEVRARTTAELEHLEVRRQEIAGAVAEARAEIEALRQDHDAGSARLQAEIGALSEERVHLAAALAAARLAAEAERRADIDERDRLEQELEALGEERAQAVAAVEAARIVAEVARRPDVEERRRIEHEIGALRAEERRLLDDAADRNAVARMPLARGSDGPHGLDPSGQLAASVSELGSHLAAILERERAQAARRAAERRQVEALLQAGQTAPAGGSDLQPAAGARRRRRRGNQ